MTYILAFYLPYILAFYLAFYMTFYLGYILTFYLALYLAYILAFYLAFDLAFHLAVEAQRCSLSSGGPRLRSSGAHCDELVKGIGETLGEEDRRRGLARDLAWRRRRRGRRKSSSDKI